MNFVDPSGHLQVRVGGTYLQARIDPTSGRIKIDAERLANALHFGVSHKRNGNYVVWMPNGKGWEYTAREHAMFDLLGQWGIRWDRSIWEEFKLAGGVLVEKWGYRHYYARSTFVETFSQAGLLTPEEAEISFDLMEGYAAAELIVGSIGIAKVSIKGTPKTWFQKATKPGDYLNKALNRQGLKNAPNSLKEKWSEYGYDFEVRIHKADPNYGKTGNIYRVARRQQGVDANGQGFGWEYMDQAGNWYRTSVLKTNNAAAEATHIQLP